MFFWGASGGAVEGPSLIGLKDPELRKWDDLLQNRMKSKVAELLKFDMEGRKHFQSKTNFSKS